MTSRMRENSTTDDYRAAVSGEGAFGERRMRRVGWPVG